MILLCFVCIGRSRDRPSIEGWKQKLSWWKRNASGGHVTAPPLKAFAVRCVRVDKPAHRAVT